MIVSNRDNDDERGLFRGVGEDRGSIILFKDWHFLIIDQLSKNGNRMVKDTRLRISIVIPQK